MESVTVVFTNGNVVQFHTQEFDADLTVNPSRVNKYPYKNASRQDSSIYLKPNNVAGLFLTTSPARGERAIAYTVPGS
jgi:hypothetical protein